MMKKYDESEAYYDVQAELMADEELLWVGRPDPMRYALRNLGVLASGVFFVLVLVFIYNMSVSNFMGGGFNMRGFGSFFGLIMIFMLGASLWTISAPVRQYFMATRTLYGITDRRVLIISGFPSRSTQSFSPDQMQFVNIRVHPNGTGDVIFRRDQHIRPRRRNTIQMGDQTYTVETGFFGVHNPREVEAIMLETFMRSKP